MVNSKSRLINLAALLLIGGTVLTVVMLASGSMDPMPETGLIWGDMPQSMNLDPGSTSTRWLHHTMPAAPLLIRLTAGRRSGEMDIAYGLVLDDGQDEVVIAVSPAGYVAIWKQDPDDRSGQIDYYLPWQTWPHVRTGNLANELSVISDGEKSTIRINREWLLETPDIKRTERVGLHGASYGGETSIDIRSAEVSEIKPGM